MRLQRKQKSKSHKKSLSAVSIIRGRTNPLQYIRDEDLHDGKANSEGCSAFNADGTAFKIDRFFYVFPLNMIETKGWLVQLFSVYSFVLIVLSSGLSTAVSNLTAVGSRWRNSVKIIKTALLLVFLIGIPVGLIVHFLPVHRNNHCQRRKNLVVFSIHRIPSSGVAASSVREDIFTDSIMPPSSASQMLEQAVKVIAAFFVQPNDS